jgi:hypothetical protein
LLNRLSKYSIFPSSTFSAVIGLSSGTGTGGNPSGTSISKAAAASAGSVVDPASGDAASAGPASAVPVPSDGPGAGGESCEHPASNIDNEAVSTSMLIHPTISLALIVFALSLEVPQPILEFQSTHERFTPLQSLFRYK